MKSFCVYLVLTMVVGIYVPFLSILLGIFFLFTKSFPLKYLFVFLCICFLLRIDLQVCNPIDTGKVISLNRSSVTVQKGLTKVMVQVNDVSMYAMHDHITLYSLDPIEMNMNQDGFNTLVWAKANGICYRSVEADTYRIEGKGFVYHLSKGGMNTNASFVRDFRALLFQSDPEGMYDLWVSMGMVYWAGLNLIKRLCVRLKSIWIERCISIAGLGLIGVVLGAPLVWIRIMLAYGLGLCVEDRMLRWSLTLFVCLWITPYGITQLAFLFPFSIQAVSLFFDRKWTQLMRFSVAFWCLLMTMKRVSILSIVFFPLNRVLNLGLVLLGLLSSTLSFLQGPFNLLYQALNQWFILLNEHFVVRGHGSLGLIVLFFYCWHCAKKKNFYLKFFLISLVNGLLIVSSWPWFYTISMLYVGQGDAILLQAPFNQSVVLIDTGPPTQYANLKASLDHRGISSIDHLIITHDDLDHNGNVESLVEDFEVKNIIVKGRDVSDAWFFLNYLPVKEADNDNDRSLVYQLQLEHVRFLFMGDLGISGELQLIKQHPHLRADVLKIGHHGSKTSSSLAFLNHVQARIALISAGKNSYGHPSWDVMERLKRLSVYSYVAQEKGTVQIVITAWFRFIQDRTNQFAFF